MSDPARAILAEAMISAMMLRPVIFHISQAGSAEEIDAIVNDAIDRGWLLPEQLPLLEEGILATTPSNNRRD